jgi:hypothetical protein
MRYKMLSIQGECIEGECYQIEANFYKMLSQSDVDSFDKYKITGPDKYGALTASAHWLNPSLYILPESHPAFNFDLFDTVDWRTLEDRADAEVTILQTGGRDINEILTKYFPQAVRYLSSQI